MSDPTRRRQTVVILCLVVYAALAGSGGLLGLSWLRTTPDPLWDLKRLFYDVAPPSPNRYGPAKPHLPPGEENRSPQPLDSLAGGVGRRKTTVTPPGFS